MKAFRLTPPALSERQVTLSCLDLLNLRGWWAVRCLAGRFWTMDKKRVVTGAPAGTPDYFCGHALYPGFFLEMKRPVGGVLRRMQVFQIRAIEQGFRIPCLVTRSPKVLKEFLDRHEKK
jgi:hypothetical protein